jgi:hypothetical protein
MSKSIGRFNRIYVAASEGSDSMIFLEIEVTTCADKGT